MRAVPGETRRTPTRSRVTPGGGQVAVLTIVLLVILVLLLLGALPSWPYSRGWGYAPAGLLSVVVIILVVLLVMGRI